MINGFSISTDDINNLTKKHLINNIRGVQRLTGLHPGPAYSPDINATVSDLLDEFHKAAGAYADRSHCPLPYIKCHEDRRGPDTQARCRHCVKLHGNLLVTSDINF